MSAASIVCRHTAYKNKAETVLVGIVTNIGQKQLLCVENCNGNLYQQQRKNWHLKKCMKIKHNKAGISSSHSTAQIRAVCAEGPLEMKVWGSKQEMCLSHTRF